MADYINLEIDTEECDALIRAMRAAMTEEQFNNAMAGIFKRTGNKVRTILSQDLPQQYKVQKGDVRSAVKTAKTSSGGAGGVGCIIPVKDERHQLGGRASSHTFGSTGCAPGWVTLPRRYGGQGKKYRVTAKVLVGGAGTLPERLSSYSGYPPFRNSKAPSLNNLVYTRTGVRKISKVTKKKFDEIRKVKAIAIPQMPMNRSEKEVQNDIGDYLIQQMEHRFMALLKVGK